MKISNLSLLATVGFFLFVAIATWASAEQITISDIAELEERRVEMIIKYNKTPLSEEQKTAMRQRMKSYITGDFARFRANWVGKPTSQIEQCYAESDRIFAVYKADLDAILAWPEGKDPKPKQEPRKTTMSPSTERVQSFTPEQRAKLKEKFKGKDVEALEKSVFEARNNLEDALKGLMLAKNNADYRKKIMVPLGRWLGGDREQWFGPNADSSFSDLTKMLEKCLADFEGIIKEPEKRLGNLNDLEQCKELAKVQHDAYSPEEKERLASEGRKLALEHSRKLNGWHTGNDTYGLFVPKDPQKRIWLGNASWKEPGDLAEVLIHELTHLSLRTEDTAKGLLTWGEKETTYGRFDSYLVKGKEEAIQHADSLTFAISGLAEVYRNAQK